ncbi:phosphoenolpyruvate carboxylase [Acidisphaera sp. L21]|uniref:phosphoenolpyruvate carboxylase n=1 Tax=Acidisphaera sp. L21 TaxID=1641851 RepID=UPI00131AF40D|nr:phosphoenolpyruvate carboxylase [Acidisphaera sp. L21]
MTDPNASSELSPDPVVRDLLALVQEARHRSATDPFGSPVLSVAQAIIRQMDSGALSLDMLDAVVRQLRDEAFDARAIRIRGYLGGLEGSQAAMEAVAARLVRPDPADSPVPFRTFRAAVERTRFAAVFTAHPTFSLPRPQWAALAAAASGGEAARFESHRPSKPTLVEEFDQALVAIVHGRDAIDGLSRAILGAAQAAWPDRWRAVVPRPVILATWVGYDTDGRTDIGWWDTLRLRLVMKRHQLARVREQVGGGAAGTRLDEALVAVDAQIAACPAAQEPDAVAAFAAALVRGRDAALVTAAPVLQLLDEAIAAAPDPMALMVARAGLASHGLSLAHTHVRLNAAQLHNAARVRLGLAEPPADASRRRVLLAAMGEALDKVQPEPVDFGALMAEQSSAARLMMTVTQIAKHVDGTAPVRFLIAETESGYTLLTALWLARLFGVEKHVEISPLFETAEALEDGARVIAEALRSPHWCDYLRATGRMCLQFGYSDSGRYVGQLAASYLIERLRLKAAELLVKHGLTDVEVVLFDTHGESIGRGAHPGSLADRLKYISPTRSRMTFAAAGIATREESAFQGGDGYLLFGTPALASATIARCAEHVYATMIGGQDPIYTEPDFAADFFATIGSGMRELVEDPGYAALLGTFGPALLDATGSRPSARQSDSGGPAMIRHPRELRAIPNNAILQQLGWCANTLQGLGAAAARHREDFAPLMEGSPRFRRALDFAAHALAHSDLDVLRAVVGLVDPGAWLDRVPHAGAPGQAAALMSVARALDRLGLWQPVTAMSRRIQLDYLALLDTWPDAPRMGTQSVLLHALRIAAIQRIWLLGTEIPEFSPRHGVTRQGMEDRLIRLDIPACLALLAEIFPTTPHPAAARDYAEPVGRRTAQSYEREHAAIFEPIRRLFGTVREIGAAITHDVGAFG